jgi:CelD/BcsL family acetyltransferase involved in cellulose biosynthesis
MSSAVSSTVIISEDAELLALAPEWDALFRRVHGQHHESFDVAWLSWRRVAKPQGRELCCLVRREHGELVLVWPMVMHRTLFCRVLRPLGPGTADYTAVLLADVPDKRALIADAWRRLLEHARPDLSYLPYLADGSELQLMAAREPGVLAAEHDSGAIAKLSKESDWASFHKALGPLPGKSSAQLARRLEKSGKVEFKVLAGGHPRAELAVLVDWMLARKREWAARADKHGPWLSSPGFREYLLDLLDNGARPPAAMLFVITLDDAPVAVTLCGLGATMLFGLMNGFDNQYARVSPGKLSLEFLLKWSLEHGIDVDLGVGAEPHKGYWSRNNVRLIWSYEYGHTRWGRLSARGKLALLELRARVEQLRARALSRRARHRAPANVEPQQAPNKAD